jgi:hypothetical protein
MKTHRPRGWSRISLIAMLLAAGGCIQESNGKGELVYQYEFWVPLAALAIGAVATPIGWILRERSARFGWSLVVLGPIAMVLVAPSLFCECAHVSEQGFHIRTGIWGLTSVHALQFADIKQIRVSSETTFGRRGRRTSYYLHCDKKAGGSSKVSISNGVSEASALAILEQADARGIPILDQTGERLAR